MLLLGQLVVLATAVRDRRLGVWLRAWRDALRAMSEGDLRVEVTIDEDPIVAAEGEQVGEMAEVFNATLNSVEIMAPSMGATNRIAEATPAPSAMIIRCSMGRPLSRSLSG